MRILHVTTGLDTGGAETMLLRLLSASKSEWESAVVSLMEAGSIGARISELGVPVLSLGLRRAMPNPLRTLPLIRFARRFHPQIVQGWMYHGNLMASLAGVSCQKRVPVIWNIRQSLYDIAMERRHTAAAIRLGAIFSRHPKAVIYNSEVAAEQHEAFGYNPLKRIVIPNGFDCNLFRPDIGARQQVRDELGIANDAILVGLIARHHPAKDHANFLRAAGFLAQTHPGAYFLLAGTDVTGEQQELRKLVEEHQLQKHAFLLGEREDLPRITAALDIACSSSRTEGFSQTLGEAMACGVPCVATDVGDSARILGGTGLLVPRMNHQALAQALGQLIDAGSEHRKQLGVAARRRIESNFSMATMVCGYADLYNRHIACRPSLDNSSGPIGACGP